MQLCAAQNPFDPGCDEVGDGEGDGEAVDGGATAACPAALGVEVVVVFSRLVRYPSREMVARDLIPEVVRTWVSSVPAVPIGVAANAASSESADAQRNHEHGSESHAFRRLACDAKMRLRTPGASPISADLTGSRRRARSWKRPAVL